MNRATAVAFAVVAGVAIGAVGYIAGSRFGLTVADPAPVALAPASDTAEVPATPLPQAAVNLVQLGDEERAAVEAIIRNYLLTNPEVIRDAINELQRREDEAARFAQMDAISENSDRLFSTAGDVVFGNPAGDVTLVEFFDYNCGFCRRAHADMKQLIANDPNLRVVLKEFPVLGEGSVQAAKVSTAVLLTTPDRYEEFHNALISETGQIDGEWALAIAADIGLDSAILREKMESEEVLAEINQSYALGGVLNLTGTPSYVTNKEVIVGAIGYEALTAYLARARDCVTAATC